MLSDKFKSDIEKVATDPAVQMCCVSAMFNECERGTDLWESLEEDCYTFMEETRVLIWHIPNPFEDEDNGSEEDVPEYDCLYNSAPSEEVINYLLDQVEVNIRKKVVV
jgi:hypothetical protein